MSRFIFNPNLPKSAVKKLICGTKDQRILSFFNSHFIEVLSIVPDKAIDKAIASHADLYALHLCDNKIIVDKSQTALIEKLSELGMTVYTTKRHISGKYPSDVSLNFAVFGENAIGNFKYADENLVSCLNGKRQINVNQGYCKCSTLIINDNAIITDDESIYKKMLLNGIDSLLISKGDIYLEGHDYGFIGGASFKLSYDTVAFIGDVSGHRDYNLIKAFVEKHGCKIISTDNGRLRDIGGVISLTENN